MYCVVRKGAGIQNYHATFHSELAAREYAENLKSSFGHNYDVLKLSTVWTTQTLTEEMEK